VDTTTAVGRPVLYRAVLDQDAVQLGWLGGAEALSRARVLLADNVARFYWGPGPECWALSDFPTLLPPGAGDGRADWFCEWTFPWELSSARFGPVALRTGAPWRCGAWLVARPRAGAGRANPRLAGALEHLATLVPIPRVLSACLFEAYGEEAPLFHPVIHVPLGPDGASYQIERGDDLALVDEVSAIDARDQRGAPFPAGAALLPVFALAVALLGCANATLREHRAAGAGPFCTLLIDGADRIPVGHFLRRDGRPPRWVAR
jgi:hypothetical protein